MNTTIHASPELLLLLSIAALPAGPVLYALLSRARGALRVIELLVVAGVGVLILFEVLPRTLEAVGVWAIAAAVLGFLFPFALEFKSHAEQVDIVIGVIALALHTAFDGAALGIGEEASALPAAIVLHRLPVGLFVWFLVRPSEGIKRATAVLALMALSTTLGFWLGGHLAIMTGGFVSGFEAFVGGTLLHVLRGHARPGAESKVSAS